MSSGVKSVGVPVALLIVIALSGCIGKEGPSGPAEASLSAAPPAQFDDKTGAIAGIVTDDAFVPIPGVDLGLREATAHAAKSDPDGRFTFSRVEPGEYTLDVSKIGYQSVALPVEVTAGRTTDVPIQLESAPLTNQTYSVVTVYNGLIVCGSGNPLFTEVVCGAVVDEQRQKFLFNYDIKKEATGQLWEMTWKPTQLLSRDLALFIEKDGCGLSCPSSSTFSETFGCCYMRVAKDDAQMDIADVKAGSEGAKIQSRTFPSGANLEPEVNVYTEQTFTIYWEQFFGKLPNDFLTTRTNLPS